MPTVGSSGHPPLVRFRAGRMTLNNGTVTADPHKGLVYIERSNDGLTHFCWRDREAKAIVEDLIVFPDEVEFKKIPQCTTGRVFVLKFKTSDRRFFFWMQEPDASADDALVSKVNRLLAGEDIGGNMDEDDAEIEDGIPSNAEEAFAQLAGLPGMEGMSQQDIMVMFGGSDFAQAFAQSVDDTHVPAEATTPAASAVTGAPTAGAVAAAAAPMSATDNSKSTEGNVTEQQAAALRDLSTILQGMSSGSSVEAQASLRDILSADNLHPALQNDPRLRDQLASLLPGDQSESNAEGIRTELTSAQFSQALQSFQHGLQTGQMGPLLSQFGLDPSAGLNGVNGFLQAVQNQADDTNEEVAGEGGESKDDDCMDES